MTTALDDKIRRELDSRRGEWRGIAQAADVSHSWISQFVRGLIPNPGYATLCRLQAQLWPKGEADKAKAAKVPV